MTIEARAPSRIDLAGGTVDIWPLSILHKGACTVNIAIDLFAKVTIEPGRDRVIRIESKDRKITSEVPSLERIDELDERLSLLKALIKFFEPPCGFDLATECASPEGAGLGGSSSLAVALAGALVEMTGKRMNRREILTVLPDLETSVIGVPAGVQDYYPAMYGGLNCLTYRPGNIEREEIASAAGTLRELTTLVYTGKQRFSGTNNWEIVKRRIEGDEQVLAGLDGIVEAARNLRSSLGRARDRDGIFRAVMDEMNERRKLFSGITSAEIDFLTDTALEAGAGAWKVCGAGGGGCFFILSRKERKEEVEKAVREAGGRIMDFEFAEEGLTVTSKGKPAPLPA